MGFIKRKAQRIFFALSLVAVCLFPWQVLCGEETVFRATCGECHETGAGILPTSHKNYSMRNTAACFVCHRAGGRGKPLAEKIHSIHSGKAPEAMKECSGCHTGISDQ
jgi:hypothetical protein